MFRVTRPLSLERKKVREIVEETVRRFLHEPLFSEGFIFENL